MKNYFRVTTVSPRVYVGDVRKNFLEHLEILNKISGEDKHVSLVVFPELSLTGYTCGDLFLTDGLLGDTQQYIKQLVYASVKFHFAFIVGAISLQESKLYNTAYLFYGGNYWTVNKKNLPGYQEFYEYRWFTPEEKECSGVFLIDGVRVGIEICEDLWVPNPPSEKLVTEYGAEVIVNISASPRLSGKYDYLKKLLEITSGRLLCSYVYLSSGPWESTSDLVFSGWSLVYENSKKIAELTPPQKLIQEPRLLTTEIDICWLRNIRRKQKLKHNLGEPTAEFFTRALPPEVKDLNRSFDPLPFVTGQNFSEVFRIQSLGLQKRLSVCNSKVVVGVSGGTDSTLALLVAVDAMDKLGRNRKDIIGVTLPCFGTTKRTKRNALKLMETLGIDSREIDITESVTAHLKELGHPLDVYDIAFENVQARERTQILFNLSNMVGGIVLGTGDMSELALGWCTYGGDHLSSYNPNVSVPKTLVKALLGWYTGEGEEIVKDILDTPISPELLPPGEDGEIKQISEDTVGPYELHDFFLYHLLRTGRSWSNIWETCCVAFSGRYDALEIKKWMEVFKGRFKSQQFKRNCLPDGPKTGSVSLSPRGDWRMPADL